MTEMYYLYRHIRLDTNQPFYIGIGKKTSTDIKNNSFGRAESIRDRNDFWNSITSKTKFGIDILMESNDRDFIQNKEREFINLYGRRDLHTGSLCNLTDGGDNGLNRSQLAVDKQLATSKINGTYQPMVDRMKKYAKKKGDDNPYISRKTFLYSVDGTFVSEYKSREECGRRIGVAGNKVTKCITNSESTKGFIPTNDYMGVKLDTSSFKIKKSKTKRVSKICPLTNRRLWTFNSMSEAAKSINSTKADLSKSISLGYRRRGYYWKYI